MYLVDTSVWIDFLRGNATPPVDKLKQLLSSGLPFGITPAIYQEILQGADSSGRFQQFADYFGTQRFYYPQDPVSSTLEAARIYLRCRLAGVTIHSAMDCLIARTAIEHELLLLHDDRDYRYMAGIITELRLA